MNPDNDRRYFKVNKIVPIIIGIALVAGLLGWALGNNKDAKDVNETNNTATESAKGTTNTDNKDITALMTYNVPDGWKEARCESVPRAIYLIPAGAPDLNCDANPSAPVKLSVDSGSTKDCNELQNVSNVKKHVCISLFINDHRSLRATTEYLENSEFKEATTVNAYYIDIGSDVIKAEYVYANEAKYQTGFDQLINSIK